MRTGQPKRVLLVDDSQEFLRAARRFLCNLSWLNLVGEATSGEQALELAATLRPDLVLMDLEMHGMTGLAATTQIRRQPDAPKVVILTIHPNPHFRQMAAMAGADAYVRKEDLVLELPRTIASLFPDDAAPDNAKSRPD